MRPVRIHFRGRLSLYFWRFLSFLLILVCFFALFLIGRTFSSTRQDIVLYEAYPGREVTVRSLSGRDYSVPEKCIEDQILMFVESIRTVERNVTALRRNWMGAYRICTPAMRRKMDGYYRDWSPETMSQKTVIYISPYSLSKREEDYEVVWREFVWDTTNNSYQGENFYRALCGVVIRPPQTEKDMEGNPLGIYIDTFSVSYIKGGEETL